MNYILLSDGVTTIDRIFEDILTKNTKNSSIKSAIDTWYKKYILPYDSKVEDTIFCNDRSILKIGGWKADGGRVDESLIFGHGTYDLSCTNETDKFSISNPAAKLTYKVALMEAPDMALLNNKTIRRTGQQYWLLSPGSIDSMPIIRYVYHTGEFIREIYGTAGVRPAISLVPGVEYTDGDGSKTNPYVVE